MDARIVSATEPQSCQTGTIWLRPGSSSRANSVFLKLGAQWIELATNDEQNFDFDNLTILIGGKKMSFEKNTLNITDILTNQVDTANFAIDDIDGTNMPVAGQEVLIFKKASAGAEPELIYGGVIVQNPQSNTGIFKYKYDVQVSDYSYYLNKQANVAEVYSNMLFGDIVRDIITKYVPEIGTLYIDNGILIDYISFNYKYPAECIQDLCDQIGSVWWVDCGKNIHCLAAIDNPAPYTLTDNPIDAQYKDLSVAIDKTQLRNRVTVRGGYELSPLYSDDVQAAIAGQTSFSIKYTPYAPVTIWINGAQKTLGIENIDTSGFDFVLNQTEKVVKCLDHAPLSAGDIVNPRYQYQIPIMVSWADPKSIDAVKALEGGNGIYEAPPIVDDTIATTAAAIDRAKAEIAMYSNPMVTGSFTTTQSGYKSGQVLVLNITSRGLDNVQVLIQQVSAQSLGNGKFEYTIDFATELKGLTQFLLKLFDAGRKVSERTDEILNLGKPVYDAVKVIDEIPTYITRDPVASPFVFDTAKFDLSVFG